MQRFQDYVDFLFGPEVWVFVSMSKGKVVNSPALEHVLDSEQALRDRAAPESHSGIDISKAFEVAMSCDKLRMQHLFDAGGDCGTGLSVFGSFGARAFRSLLPRRQQRRQEEGNAGDRGGGDSQPDQEEEEEGNGGQEGRGRSRWRR